MAARNIVEGTVDLIVEQIKANILSALSGVRANRGDAAVTTEVPVSYFTYEPAIAYKTPAVFVIGDNVEFLQSRGQNHINCQIRVFVSIVVEDRKASLLTIKGYRYHDALHEILDRAVLDSADGKSRNKIKVVSSQFGSTVPKKSAESDFRKEVMLELTVEHFEQE